MGHIPQYTYCGWVKQGIRRVRSILKKVWDNPNCLHTKDVFHSITCRHRSFGYRSNYRHILNR
jgi:hypothetical protein